MKTSQIKDLVVIRPLNESLQNVNEQYLGAEKESVEGGGGDPLKDISSSTHSWTKVENKIFLSRKPNKTSIPAGLYDIRSSQFEGIFLESKTVTLDELFLIPNDVLDLIIDDFEKFWASKDLYEQYKFTYKRGILMFGRPGCGKTTLNNLLTKQIIEKFNGIVLNVNDLATYIPMVHNIRAVTKPLVRQPEHSTRTPLTPFSTKAGNMETRKPAPVDILRQRDVQKVKQTTKPGTAIARSRINEIERSIDEPKELDKAKEQSLLTRYISDYVLPNVAEPNGQRMHKELAHNMATRIKTKSLMDPGSQIEAQLLGDTNSMSEQVMLKKIEELVTETRVKVQLAKITGTEPELAEKHALVSLHRKIQESGMTDMFDKVKTTLMADLMKDATQMPDVTTATKAEEELPNNKMKTDEEEEERHNRTQGSFQPIEIERDPIADRARREFLRKAAEHAFIEAESKGEHEIHGADIVHAAGNPQKTEIKSEPVRYDALPDYSITETMIDIERTNKPITSIEQANDIIRREVDDKAPVRLRKRPTQEIRYWTDLVRVFGHLLTPAEMHPKAA
jgi:energy-coupling factor transporter ATP-binding protein EcfA2